jgi:hypothetical protein
MSKAANLAGFATAVSPPSDLTVGIITATTVSATNITGTVTGDATGLSGTPDIDVRNITGVAATFTGNVSIAGTLTYEDVTNVDSVGLITARSGVDVTGGSVVVGSAVTISSGGVLAGVVTATTGCITGTFTGATVCGGTVCATTGFSGDGANVTNIPASNVTGLSGGGGFCIYTSPGTFSVPPGTTSLKITAIGGGAPGGTASSAPTAGNGGPAAIALVRYMSIPPSCSSYPVTVGGAGGDTIFGGPTVFLAEGAFPSVCPYNSLEPSKYCTPALATYRIQGYQFERNLDISPTTSGPGGERYLFGVGLCALSDNGGGGASSIFGGGGCGQGGGPGFQAWPGCGYGAGGGGASCNPSVPGPAFNIAGNGSPGFMIVEW